jgi:hypothetical protein
MAIFEVFKNLCNMEECRYDMATFHTNQNINPS